MVDEILDFHCKSFNRLKALLIPLTAAELATPSYAAPWSIADVASHLGSQAEIFGLFVDAAAAGEPTPGGAAFGPVWDRWNGLPPAEQALQSIVANEAFVSPMEALSPQQRESFRLDLFGSPQDLEGLISLRLSEHAMHTWDVAVALDPSAVLLAEAVDLLIDTVLDRTARRSGKAIVDIGADSRPITVETTSPARTFTLAVAPEVSFTADGEAAGDPLSLPTEALLRLVYGRLDPEHTPAGVEDARLTVLRTVFTGF